MAPKRWSLRQTSTRWLARFVGRVKVRSSHGVLGAFLGTVISYRCYIRNKIIVNCSGRGRGKKRRGMPRRKAAWNDVIWGGDGAQERTRTSTALRPLRPERSASASSATWALLEMMRDDFDAGGGECQRVGELGWELLWRDLT